MVFRGTLVTYDQCYNETLETCEDIAMGELEHSNFTHHSIEPITETEYLQYFTEQIKTHS